MPSAKKMLELVSQDNKMTLLVATAKHLQLVEQLYLPGKACWDGGGDREEQSIRLARYLIQERGQELLTYKELDTPPTVVERSIED